MKKIYFFILNFFCVATCAQVDQKVHGVTLPRITVWIHGTQPDKLLPSIAFAFNQKLVSYFQYSIPGLAPIQDIPSSSYTRAIAHSLADASSVLFPFEHFYQFGWDGDATVPVRRQSGHQLYYALKALVAQYVKQYGCAPVLTLISHSHGGNVILHMHELCVEDNDHFVVDRVILLACPIQVETVDFVESPLFRSVINVYSEDDLIQVIDPQWLQPFIGGKKQKGFSEAWNKAMHRPWFSKRTIKNLPHTKNIRVSWCAGAPWRDCEPYLSQERVSLFKKMSDVADFFNSTRGLSHIEIELPFFLKHIPKILEHADGHCGDYKEKVTLEGKLSLQVS